MVTILIVIGTIVVVLSSLYIVCGIGTGAYMYAISTQKERSAGLFIGCAIAWPLLWFAAIDDWWLGRRF